MTDDVNAVLMLVDRLAADCDGRLTILAYALAAQARSCGVDRDDAVATFAETFDVSEDIPLADMATQQARN